MDEREDVREEFTDGDENDCSKVSEDVEDPDPFMGEIRFNEKSNFSMIEHEDRIRRQEEERKALEASRKGYCNMCGKCCEALYISQSPEELKNLWTPDGEIDITSRDYDWAFAKQHFQPISDEEAFRRNPYHQMHVESDIYRKAYFYECDMYDPQTHKCTAHDKRPNICRDYPYYGGKLSYYEWYYDPNCPYIEDAPALTKELWIAMVEEVRRQAR